MARLARCNGLTRRIITDVNRMPRSRISRSRELYDGLLEKPCSAISQKILFDESSSLSYHKFKIRLRISTKYYIAKLSKIVGAANHCVRSVLITEDEHEMRCQTLRSRKKAFTRTVRSFMPATSSTGHTHVLPRAVARHATSQCDASYRLVRLRSPTKKKRHDFRVWPFVCVNYKASPCSKNVCKRVWNLSYKASRNSFCYLKLEFFAHLVCTLQMHFGILFRSSFMIPKYLIDSVVSTP